jgi:hypothetical protein
VAPGHAAQPQVDRPATPNAPGHGQPPQRVCRPTRLRERVLYRSASSVRPGAISGNRGLRRELPRAERSVAA